MSKENEKKKGLDEEKMNVVLSSLAKCKEGINEETAKIAFGEPLNFPSMQNHYYTKVEQPKENNPQEKPDSNIRMLPDDLESVLNRNLNQMMQEEKEKPIPKILWGDDGKGNALWYENEFSILFGRTNTGKSIYAVQIAEHITRNLGMKVLYLDLEMSMKQFQLRYTSANGDLHLWSENMIRPDMGKIEWALDNPVKSMELLKKMLDTTGAKILILDNLTFLMNNGGMKAEDVKMICSVFCEWAKSGYSILVVNHTPKIKPFTSLDINDCLGSSMLTNFVQSVFAIGTDSRNPSTGRYVKQLKSRNGKIVWDATHVLSYQIDKTIDPGMLQFIQPSVLSSATTGLPVSIDTARESELLKNGDTEILRQIDTLHIQGKSNREIAKALSLSATTVGKRINQILSSPSTNN